MQRTAIGMYTVYTKEYKKRQPDGLPFFVGMFVI